MSVRRLFKTHERCKYMPPSTLSLWSEGLMPLRCAIPTISRYRLLDPDRTGYRTIDKLYPYEYTRITPRFGASGRAAAQPGGYSTTFAPPEVGSTRSCR